jgi:lipoprotein-anchoring transpeptidase ErfK/SrfK
LSLPAIGDVASKAPNYPNTNQTFQIPDPNQVKSSFGRTTDAIDQPKTDLVPTDLALAGGNADSSMTGSSAISQTTALDARDAAPSGSQGSNTGLANALRLADKQYSADKPEEALATLSIFYNTPNLSGEERAELLSRLDPLARDVIYSQRHLLEQPHRVGQNETLMEIAARYEVPWQLLANINQVQDPVTILPGTELKVVRGPFRAEVNLSMNELTLFLGDHYAGRFPIGVGTDPAPKPGTFTIQDKQTERTYYNRAGSPVPPGTPGNPYGNIWLGLGGQLCIHGSPSASSPTDKGCISLAADFADDLYGILSQGSSVTIRR